eukprot:TRINITY_DN8218_c0_g1_i1.p1 TRINITY_DN8218_c0_g1~~TRINITY_DN8218_c0_g1_i1.p1  ORF type:complete len:129 (+),score=22.43 TRINITY_DN8218_c0_g1_i1:264-650(+)
MAEIFQSRKAAAFFLTVYIQEAHPADEWNLYSNICFSQPKTLTERVGLCKDYLDQNEDIWPKFDNNLDYPNNRFAVVVDTMQNSANLTYSAWPERLYVIQNNKIVYKGDKGPDGYHPEEVDDWLGRKQ